VARQGFARGAPRLVGMGPRGGMVDPRSSGLAAMSGFRAAKATKTAKTKHQSEAEQGLYLVAELASLMARTRLADWPPYQADLFLRRLREIIANAINKPLC
jgi:hypothetical protein